MAKIINLETLSNLSVDEANRLYWKGELVVTQSMIDLPTWVDIAVGAAAIAGVIHVAMNVADRFGWLPPRDLPIDRQTSFPGGSGGYSGTRTRQDTSEGADD